ncbi:MAG: GNAT family N-acetyltransferase [Clostridia bacterium]|nr:GNAT family N-acetyltransferase [Clostridia bacterium]
MELKILTQEEKTQYRGAILALLEESDEDFLPPLSRRRSTKDQTFSGEAAVGAGVLSYYEAMSRQEILVAVIDGEMAGFVSFYENFEGGEAPNIYVSTLVVAKAARGRGLTAKMYDHLFNTLVPDRHVYTRTWSTNAAHAKILARFGFTEYKRLPNDRGCGIDTVYYARALREPALSV